MFTRRRDGTKVILPAIFLPSLHIVYNVFSVYLDKKQENNSLEEFLNNTIFGEAEAITIEPNENMVIVYEKFLENYKKGLTIEQEAVEYLKK